jgi:methylglutaconyl-CoA hydratase
MATRRTTQSSAPHARNTTPAARATPGRDASMQAPRNGYTRLAIEIRNAIALVALDRPDVHNAFDETLIAELTDALTALDRAPEVRAVVLRGAGRSFCAGADLNWMRRTASYGKRENLADARALAQLLATLAGLSKPTIARVHGNVFGGGVGLVACCDVAIGAQDAVFALSEAKLGLVPATIGPYVVEAIGARQARRYFVTAERFTAAEAHRIGLLHELAPLEELDARVNQVLDALVLAGPRAQAEAKALVRRIAHRPIDAAVIEATAQQIAALRASPEGREGIAAFLSKRPAAWVRPAPAADDGDTPRSP